jgi:hypothetical protein
MKDYPKMEKKACALVLSYYTGYKDNSDRSSRNVSVLIRGLNCSDIVKKWNDGEHFYPVIYYLTKAISCLPFYWGHTLRCVNLTKKQALSYQPGTVVTWMQWSSSKIGKKPAGFFQKEILGFIYILLVQEKFHNSQFIQMKKKLFILLFLIF